MTLRRSFGWTSSQFVVVLIIELIGLAILARILTPQDMGAYAAAFALLRLALFLGGFGLNTVIVRAPEITPALCRQVLGIAMSATAVVLVIYAIGYWAIPVTPDSAEYRGLLLVMLPVALVSCFSMPSNAMLSREMRFQALFVARAGSTLAYQAVAIPMALGGWAAVSLACGMVASTVVFAVVANIATRGCFLVWPSLRGAAETTRFASVLFATTAVNEAREAGLVMLVGRLAGLAPLGILSRARDLVTKSNSVVVETIMPVLVPHVYKVARDGEDLREHFRIGWTYLTAITLPAAVGLCLLAPAIVALLLGDQWGDVSVILSILAVGIAIQPLNIMVGTYVVALGGEVPRLVVALVYLVVSLVMVAMLAPDGLVDMVVGLVLTNLMQLALLLGLLFRRLEIGLGLLWEASAKSLLLAVATGLPLMAISGLLPDLSDAVFILVGFAGGCFGWLVCLGLTRHPFLAEVSLARTTLQGARKRRGHSS